MASIAPTVMQSRVSSACGRSELSRARPFTTRMPSRRATLHVRAESDPEKAVKEAAGKIEDAAKDAKETVEDTSNLSPEMKKRMRDEYVGFGGSPNQPLKQNYFLLIIVGIAVLAILSAITGAI